MTMNLLPSTSPKPIGRAIGAATGDALIFSFVTLFEVGSTLCIFHLFGVVNLTSGYDLIS